MRRLVFLAVAWAAPAAAGVGAITGERTVSQSVPEHAAACHAGVPSMGVLAGNSVAVTLDVPGLDSLRCLVARLGTETGRARARVDRVSCEAPDRTVDLTCEMSLTVNIDAYGSSQGNPTRVGGLLDAALAAELDASKLAILPDRIELAGDLPSEKARTELEAAAAKTGTPVRSFGLEVHTALKADAMPDLAKGTGPAKLHVAGITAASALAIVGDASRPFVALADGAPITGRLAAGSRAALARSLTAAHPVKSALVASTGKYKKVDLSFQRIEARKLVDILADVMNVSAALPPGAGAQPMSAFTKNTPSEAVMASIAKALGLAQVQIGGIVYFVPVGTKIRTPAATDGARRTLNVDGASASETLSLLAADSPVPFCLAAGKPLDVKIRNGGATHLAEALRVLDGGEPTDAASCPAAPTLDLKTGAELSRLRLLATLTGGTPTRALVRKEDGSVAILSGGPPVFSITQQNLAFKLGSERGELALGEPDDPTAPASILDHRLVATLVSPQGSIAVFEGRRGRARVLQTGWNENGIGMVEVLPGSVKLTAEGYDDYGYRTRATRELLLRPAVK